MTRTGRPKLPDDERRTNVLRIRLTERERTVLDQAALQALGQPQSETSTWAREQLLAFAKAILSGKAGQSGPS